MLLLLLLLILTLKACHAVVMVIVQLKTGCYSSTNLDSPDSSNTEHWPYRTRYSAIPSGLNAAAAYSILWDEDVCIIRLDLRVVIAPCRVWHTGRSVALPSSLLREHD